MTVSKMVCQSRENRKALSKIFNQNQIYGAGRTDKGVHALSNANAKQKEIESEKRFLNTLNFFLKKNLISITKIKKKKIAFSFPL